MKRRKRKAKPTDKCYCGLARKHHRGMGHYFQTKAKHQDEWNMDQ